MLLLSRISGLTNPQSLAIDASGNLFVTNTASVSAFSSSGIPLPGSPYTGVVLTAPIAIAIIAK